MLTGPSEQKLEVEVEATELEGGQVQLHVKVPAGPVQTVKDRLIRGFARSVSIHGFRPGKAPRAVVERHVDQDALKEQIIDELLEDAYDAALEKAGLRPLDRGRIREADLADDGGLVFSVTATRRPEIELGDYKGLQVTRRIIRVTEAQVEAELERIRSRRAQLQPLPQEAAIENGDLVIADYEMFVDGEKREDGSASGYPLEVGKDELFPQLSDALIGAYPGGAKEFEITYPEDHSDPSLAGKTAQFNATVKEARRRELPELNDEFAKQVSDLETVAALRARIQENLEALGSAIAERDVREELVRQVCDAASLDVPEAIVGREVDRRIDEITEELERRNLALHQYLQNIGRTFEDWRADLEIEARHAARRALVLDEIGEREKIAVGDEDLEEEIGRLAVSENVEEARVRERLQDPAELNRLVTRIYQRKVMELLLDHAEVTEEVAEPEAEDEAEESEERSEGEAESGQPKGAGESEQTAAEPEEESEKREP